MAKNSKKNQKSNATPEPTGETKVKNDPALSDQLSGVEERLNQRIDLIVSLLKPENHAGELESGSGQPNVSDDETSSAVEGTNDRSSFDLAQVSEALAAVAHSVRLRMLVTASMKTVRVTELLETLQLGTTGQVYHHLRILTGAGWVETNGHGDYWVPDSRQAFLDRVLGLGDELGTLRAMTQSR